MIIIKSSQNLKYLNLFYQAVNWNGNNWALRCDFKGNDLKNVRAQSELCGSSCANTNGCTHWAFTNFDSGTCWLKQGVVTKANAFESTDPSSSCGVIDVSPVISGSGK